MGSSDIPLPKPFRFMELPTEVRNEVYRLCAPKNSRVAIASYSRPEGSYRLPLALRPLAENKNCLAILGVSKQVRSEASSIIFAIVTPYIGLCHQYTGISDEQTMKPLNLVKGLLTNVRWLEVLVDIEFTEIQEFLSTALPQQVETLRIHIAGGGELRLWEKGVRSLALMIHGKGTVPRQHQPRLLLESYLSPTGPQHLPQTFHWVWARPAESSCKNSMNDVCKWPSALRTVTIVVPHVSPVESWLPPETLAHFPLRLVTLREDWVKDDTPDTACLLRRLEELVPEDDTATATDVPPGSSASASIKNFVDFPDTLFYQKAQTDQVDEIDIRQVIWDHEGGMKLNDVDTAYFRNRSQRLHSIFTLHGPAVLNMNHHDESPTTRAIGELLNRYCPP